MNEDYPSIVTEVFIPVGKERVSERGNVLRNKKWDWKYEMYSTELIDQKV